MGKCFYGLYDAMPKLEWVAHHIGGNRSILLIGQDGADQDEHDHL
jgi:hypothetical protein